MYVKLVHNFLDYKSTLKMSAKKNILIENYNCWSLSQLWEYTYN